jgi:hypothetical protein
MNHFRNKSERIAQLDFKRGRIARLHEIMDSRKRASDIASKFVLIKDLHELEKESSDLAEGDVLLGYVSEDEPNYPPHAPVFATKAEIFSNCVFAGMTGSGKSEAGSHLVRQLYPLGVQAFVYDVKGDHLPLCLLENWIWLPTELFLRNRHLAPPNVPQFAYWESETEIWAVANDLTNVGGNILKSIQLRAEESCHRVDPRRTVTDYELLIAAKEKQRELSYRDKALFDPLSRDIERLSHMVSGPYERSRAFRRGYTHVDFLETNVVRDISDLSRTRAIYEINHDLNWRYQYAKWNNLRGEKTRPVFSLIEESTTYVNPRFVSQISNFDELYKASRDFGQSCGLIVHSLVLLPPIAKNNTGVMLLMKCSNHEEILEFARITGMDEAHYELAKDLKPGEAICKLRRLPDCIKIEIPYQPLDKNVDKLFLEEKTKSYLNSLNVNVEPIDAHEVEYVMKLIFQTDFKRSRTMEKVREEGASNLRTEAIRFLRLHLENWSSSYAEIREKLNSTQTAHRAKKHCLENDWLQESTIPLGQSRPSLFFHLTDVARDVLKAEGFLRDGQNAHRIKHHTFIAVCINKKAEMLKQAGFEVVLDEGDGLDMLVRDKTGLILSGLEFNYKTGVNHELRLLEKAINRGVPRVELVVLDFEEIKKNSFRMTEPSGKIKAFRAELETNFEHINHVVELKTLNEILKWTPQS